MTKTVSAGLLMALLLVVPLTGAIDVSVSPETPAPGEPITATFPVPQGAVNATVQVCIGDKCFIPALMDQEGDTFQHTFYINETGEAHLNLKIAYQNGSVMWDNSTAFDVEEAGGGTGTPGFTVGVALAAVATIALLARRTKS